MGGLMQNSSVVPWQVQSIAVSLCRKAGLELTEPSGLTVSWGTVLATQT